MSDDPFPGWVEAELVDVYGRTWRFHDKPPIFSAALCASTRLPAEATIPCTLVGAAGAVVTVDTTNPSGVEATDGTTTFVLALEQVVDETE